MSKLKLIWGDITALKTDAIVNAANTSLLGGGGVDGAIHRAAGPGLLEECRELNGCKTGEAKVTSAYNLPSKFVIHAVGPVYRSGKSEEKELLASAYYHSLRIADNMKLVSVAFPNISTGSYGFPKELAAEIAISSVNKSLEEFIGIQKVIFCIFDQENYTIYKSLLGN